MKNILIVLIVVFGAYGVWVNGTTISADEISRATKSALIHVKVVDSAGKAVEGVTVSIRSEETGNSLQASKELKNGAIKFKVSPGQTYNVVATTSEQTASQLVTVTDGQVAQVLLTLDEF